MTNYGAACVLLGIVFAVQPAASRADPKPGDVEALVAREFERREVPGGAVVILRGNIVWLAAGFGRIAVSESTEVTPGTIFQLGSIGKSFLAALVLDLASQGKLGLDDPLASRLPVARDLPRTITVRHLLNHTSGLRELFLLPGATEGLADLSRTAEELYALALKATVDFQPGERWSYSNTNYTLLAMLVEHLTGQPYEDVLASRVFQPLGLRTLHQCRSVPSGPDEARGHIRTRRGQVIGSAPENMNWIRGDGGLCASAIDVAQWMRAVMTERPAPMEASGPMKQATATARGPAQYGFGISLIAPDGVMRIGHNGAMLGFSASAAAYPSEQLVIVVLANRGDVRTEAIERQVARQLLGLPTPARGAKPFSQAQRATVVGAYDIGVFDIRIEERDGALWLVSPPPGPSGRLRHIGDCVFVLEAEPEANQLAFSCAPPEKVTFVMGAMNWYGVRRP